MKASICFLSIALVFFLNLATIGQENQADNSDEVLIKRQAFAADFERQIKDIPYAGVRIHARYRICSWLWKDGKDLTGRAEEIATMAVDDHFRNKNEIPPGYSIIAQFFTLLDSNANDLATRLREKYKVSQRDDPRRINSLLGQQNGERLAVDAAVNLLSQENQSNPDFVYLLMQLEQTGSPELNRLLAAILAADETGRNRLPTHLVEILTSFFTKPTIPDELKRRFAILVLGRIRNIAILSELDQLAYYRTMQRLMPEISAKFPDLIGEASTAQLLLRNRTSRSIQEANERNERIRNSPDKLWATVSEADKAVDDITRYGLYRSAARLALEEKKFVYAVDLMQKATEIDTSSKSTEKEKIFRKGIHDQFLRDVLIESLKAVDLDAANHAVKRTQAPLSKADGLRRISTYHIEMNDLDPGRYAHDEAIKLLVKADSSQEGIATMFLMLPTAEKMDSSRLTELSHLIAKKINAVPAPAVDDKPGTQNYLNYVSLIMAINNDLRPALADLVRKNRNAAEDLGGRIEKREVRVFADYVLSTNSIDSLRTKNKNAETAVK